MLSSPLSDLSHLFGSEVVVQPPFCLPVSLATSSTGSMAFTALLAAAMPEIGTCIDSGPLGNGSATPRAGNTGIVVPSLKVNFAPALALNRSRANN